LDMNSRMVIEPPRLPPTSESAQLTLYDQAG
jgi:hypothetical protein